MKVLNEALEEEQGKVNEVKQQIEEFKERMAAQNLEISKRIASKEEREAQVNTSLIFSFGVFIYNIFFQRLTKEN